MISALHLLFASLWIGCVLTETVFEKTLIGDSEQQRLQLAQLHLNVDLWVEIPALLGTAICGALLIRHYPIDALLGFKLALAALTIVANLICSGYVWARAQAARQARWDACHRHDHRQHQSGTLVFFGVLITTLLGLLHP